MGVRHRCQTVAVPFWRSGRGRGADAGGGGDTVAANGAGRRDEATQGAREVEAAMRRVAEQDTPENRRALFELLLEASLTAAAVDTPPPGAEQGLAMLESKDGPVLLVFTGVDALLAWRPTGYTPVPVPACTLFDMAARYDVARIEVNPASMPRGWISRTEIAALAQGQIPQGPSDAPVQTGPQPSQVKVGGPAAAPPDALIDAVRRALDSQPHAVAGWLFVRHPGRINHHDPIGEKTPIGSLQRLQWNLLHGFVRFDKESRDRSQLCAKRSKHPRVDQLSVVFPQMLIRRWIGTESNELRQGCLQDLG